MPVIKPDKQNQKETAEKHKQKFLKATASLRASWQKALPKVLARTSLKKAPSGLRESMLYSLQAGGKRLRPLLALKAAAICGLEKKRALQMATALECLHTYSLVHDDLPAMDDDDLRRGKPTSHKVFGEGNAVLSGDALQSLAFELLALAEVSPATIAYFAACVGAEGMAGGQYLDMNSLEIEPTQKGDDESEQELRYRYLLDLHQRKTGRLIEAALVLPFLTATASSTKKNEQKSFLKKTAKIKTWGLELGLLFQISDDILDSEGTSSSLGKSVGKDARQNKLTFVSLLGVEQARLQAHTLSRKLSWQASSLFCDNFFNYLPFYVLERKS